MNLNAIQLEEFSVVTTKDKVLSLRVEESLYNFLEELSQEWNTGSVSQVVRKILSFYFMNKVYEEEWKKIHSENLESFIQELKNSGNEIELQKYKNLLEEFSGYLKVFRSIAEALKKTEVFFSGELDKLEYSMDKLQKAGIVWRGDLFEGEKEKMKE